MRHKGTCRLGVGRQVGRLRTPFAILAAIAVVAVGVQVISVLPAVAQGCSGDACNYTNPETTGCSTNAESIDIGEVTLGPYNEAQLELRYSTGCRTVWSKLDNFTSAEGLSYVYPWTNRYGSTTGPDTWGSAEAGCENDPADFNDDLAFSYQINDAGYESYAWGGVVDLSDYCGYPTGSLQSYTDVGPY